MKKPTILKSVKTVITFGTNLLSYAKCQLEDLEFYFSNLNFGLDKIMTLNRKKASQAVMFILFLLLSFTSVNAQIGKAFTPRLTGGSIKVKGDVVLIGNTVINKVNTAPTYNRNGAPQTGVLFTGTVTNLATLTAEANTPFNSPGDNNDYNVEYINVDPATGVFSSSQAELKINNSCKKIVFAGLYWSAIYPYERSTDSGKKYDGSLRPADTWKTIKFKTPGGTYQNVTADEVIFDGYNYTNVQNSFKDSPYVCFKDVTTTLQGLANADGVYTVGNVRAALGKRDGGGAGGWSLVVIYESPTMPSKFISVFDGYVGVNPDAGGIKTVDYTVNGFQTLPAPFPVNAKIGVGALEGDNLKTGDDLQFKANKSSAFTVIYDAVNPIGNFFNATVSADGSHYLSRNPNSTNTMGFDIDHVIIPNPPSSSGAINSVVPNDETGATLRLTTSSDGYGAFLSTFAVEIIEPTILLTKQVFDTNGADASLKDVTLGEQLNYVIGFENQGNDDAKEFVIKDVLPKNINFNFPGDITSLPTGMTIANNVTYDAATRTILFKIPDALVKKNLIPGPPFVRSTIRFSVKVVPTCNELSDACDNIIKNSAYATYKGDINKNQITDDPSLSSYTSCNLGTPQSTNFLVGVKDCKFTQNVVLCSASQVIKASDGYASYTWTGPGSFSATGQSVTVTQPGVYKVTGIANKPCTDYTEEITVVPFGGIATNPVIDYASQVVQCTSNGKLLPNIFLCGANSYKDIPTGINDGSVIIWEKLDESSCTASTSQNCANEGTSCTWTKVGEGPTYRADQSGQFRLTLNYTGGCFNRFYFNVYKNVFNPTETHKDIMCGKAGSITVGGGSAQYQYAIAEQTANPVPGAYQSSPTFSISGSGWGTGVTQKTYIIYIKQVGVTTNPCIFNIGDIVIRKRDFSMTATASQPLCNGDLGQVLIVANDADPQYTFNIYRKSPKTLVNTSGKISNNQYLYDQLTTGRTYTVEVITDDGCTATQDITINSVAKLTVTPAMSPALTACQDGGIKLTIAGGTSPYYYSLNGGDYVLYTGATIPVTFATLPAGGVYNISVSDANGCKATNSITFTASPKPVYTISKTDIKCYSDKGEIRVNVTAQNGYTMQYSINNGSTWSSNGTFSNLSGGTYNVLVKYTLSGTTCTDPVQVITIDSPTSELTGSGGVAELAGCTLGGNGGKLRITNVSGGVAPYQYSFDGGSTWQSSPEKDVLQGTYILVIKDNVGCTYTIPYNVKLDPKPADPTITIAPVVYNCDGTGKTTATVTNTGGSNYTYEYYLDGVANTPITNNVFNNIPTGSHEIVVKYNLVAASTYSNLLKEDFGRGAPTTSPGIAAAYCFNNQDVNIHTCPNPTRSVEDNQYSVASFFWRSDTAWYPFKDHTSNGTVADGRYLLVNIGSAAGDYGILYSKPIADVIPNQPVKVDLAVANLLNAGVDGAAPIVRFELVDPSGNVVARVDTGKIAEAKNDPNRTKWIEIPTISLNPGNNTNLTFVIRSGSLEYNGNDLLIDDISVYQLPKSCLSSRDFPFEVGSDKAFTVLDPTIQNVACSGGNTGSITITAQNFNGSFYYSVNGGTLKSSTTSPVTINGLTAGNYTVVVQSDAAGSCSKTFSKTVGTPTPVTVTAQVTTPPTCTTGATITATATGGTTPYKYELRAANGVTVITSFQDSAVFPDVPTGTYTIVAKDLNNCPSAASAAVIVNVPTPPTATLASTSDLCYDAADKATIVVTATGTGTLTYSLDGAAGVTTNTFTNVGVGTHSVVVTDSNNCKATVGNIVVAPELKATPTITKTLDCNTTGATIKVDVSGGTAPYTYRAKLDSNPYGSSISITGTSFNYAAPSAGTYTFEISDSNSPTSCKAIITATVDAITNPTVVAQPVQIACNGGSTGEVTLVASGGSGSYTYSFNNSAFSSTIKYTGLKAGIAYPFQVIDNKGCKSGIGSITLTEPTVVQGTISATELTCSSTGTVPAVVTVTGSGGTGPYQYSFNGTSNFTSVNTYSTSVAGTVTAYIKDNNNCQIGPLSVTIATLYQITDITITDSGYDCSTTPPGGHVNIAAVKGGVSAPIRYQIISGPAGYDTATNSDGEFKSLTPGNYIFQATDIKTGCSFTKSYTVNGSPDITTGGSVLTNIKCYGGTGTIQFTINGIKSRYDYVITNGSGTTIQSANNVAGAGNNTISVPAAQPVGSYTITATDRTTKCQSSYTVNLTQPAAVLDVTATAPNVNCNNYTTIITAVGTGGTTSYTYAVVQKGAAAPSTYGTDPKLTVNTVNGTVMDWDVYIKDANGCTDFVSIKILKDAVPAVTAVLNNQCTGSGNSFTITATGTGGTGALQYGINGVGGAFSSNNVFNVTASATPYTVWVKDANNCTAQATPITVYPQLTATTTVKELDCSTTSPDATITVNGNGGNAPYKYEVSTNGGTTYTLMASNVYTTSTAGTFLIRVTDANGCTFVTTTPILSISNPTVTANPVINVSCNGGTDGSVQLIGAGGSLTGGQNYQYSKDGITYGSASSFTGLVAGDHDFFVKDSKGCVGKVTVTITEPTKLVISATSTGFTCSTTNTKVAGSVTINVPTTGTSPYEYSFNGGGYGAGRTLTVNDNGSDQTINYSVKDAKGCITNGSVVLNKLNSPKINTATASAVTCTATTSTVTVTTTAGTGVGTLAYAITAPASAVGNVTGASSGVFTGLAPNATYTFKVTDANGCYDTKSVTVNPVTVIAIAGNKNNDATCKGTSTGKGTYTISGIATVGNYSFTLTAGTLGTGTLTKSGNTLTLNNVAAGTYTVEVKDLATDCTNSVSIVIGEPALALDVTAVATNINCNNDNATITATATGGTTNYSYAVVLHNAAAPLAAAYGPSATLTVDTNSGANMNWDVYVKDANGCTDLVGVSLSSDPVPTVTAVLSNQCTASGSGFTITATGAGGKGTLQYGINGVGGAFSTNNVFNVSASATAYTVWVKDANNCTASATPIMVYPQLTATIRVSKELDCSATPNAEITVDISGGKSGYTYRVDPGTGTYGSSTPVTGTQIVYANAATAGTYNFEITDSNTPACTKIVSIAVNPITNPTVTATQVNVTCNGGSNGSVLLRGAGGSGSYSYSTSLAGTYGASNSFTGLAAGLHTFYVKDSKGCTGSVDVTITEPTAIVATPSATKFTCSATNAKQSALITVTGTGGTGAYTYSYNNGTSFVAGNTLSVNDNGASQTFNIIIKDANGCLSPMVPITLAPLNSPKINTATASAVTCTATTSTVTVTTTAGTGVGTLAYAITAPASAVGNVTGASSGVFTGLAPNATYTFKVTDANGCYDTKSVTVNPVTPIAVAVSKLSDVKCKGDSTGSAKYTVSGFSATGNYTVAITSNPTGLPYTMSTTGDVITLTGLSIGDYTVSVEDNTTHCPASATITISEPTNPLTASYATVNANCLVGTSKVTVTAGGGTIAYKYAFVHDLVLPNASDFGPSNVAYLDPATTNWDVYVRDANNCEVKLDVTIAKDNAPTVTASAVGQCLGVGTYTITASGTGTGTLQYSINGTSYQAGNTFAVTTAGTYNIWVKDANGCTAQTTTPVIVNDKLTLSARLDKDITCVTGNEAAKITLTAGGGNGVYTYSFTSSPVAPSATLSGNVLTTNDAGDYIFTVTDGLGCTTTTTVPVKITVPVNPDFTMTKGPDILCNKDESGSLNIVIDQTKGLAPYTIEVLNTTTGHPYGTQTSGLAAGNYSVKVTDAKGCSVTKNITISEPPALVVVWDKNDMHCDASTGGVSKGEIIIQSVTGGTGPYDYYVTGVNGYVGEAHGIPGTSVIFEVVDFGFYQIRVVDTNGCSVFKKDVLIAAPLTSVGITIDTAASCSATGGSATITIDGAYAGAGPFHFNIYKGPSTPLFVADGTNGWIGETSPRQAVYTGLTPGISYTFIVYSESTGCYYFQAAPDPIPTNSQLEVVKDVASNITCKNAGNGSIKFAIKNNYLAATVDVRYSIHQAFTNVEIVPPTTITNLAAGATTSDITIGSLGTGTYYILVEEINGPNVGCSVVSKTNFTIEESAIDLSLSASATSIADCTNLGTISAQAKDGTGPYTYQVVAAGDSPSTTAWVSSNTFTRAGSVTGIDYDVYTKDAFGCIKFVTVKVFKYKDPTINVPPAICYTGVPFTFTIPGTVDSAIVGGATYSVNGSVFQTSPDFTFNAAGTYNLVIKDGKGCTATIPFEVKPQLKLDVKQTRDLSCIVGSEDAQFTLTATDGYSPYVYTYTYNGGTSTAVPAVPGNVLTASSIGTYVFTVTDAKNCQATYTINLDAIPTIDFAVSSVNTSCNGGSDGTITAVVATGVGPFKYQLEDGATIVRAYQDSNEFKNLPAKTTYVVRVKDARECTVTKPITIGQPTILSATSSVTTALSCTSGNAPSKAVVTVVPSGGTTPYQYSYDNGASYSSTATYETFAGATFDVMVKDANGCTVTITNGVNVPALNPPTDMDIVGTPIYCLPAARQTSTVTISNVQNGVGTKSFAILSPASQTGNVSGAASGIFTNLPAGTYLFEVKDANNCTYEESYTIDPVTNIAVAGQLTADVSCNGGNDGSATFTVSNNTGAFTYAFTTGTGTLALSGNVVTATGLVAGNYVLQVTDNTTQCTATASITVGQPAALSLVANPFVNANCNADAQASVVASGGTAPYTYSFVVRGAGAGTYTSSDSAMLNPATSLDWDVYVKDAHNCVITAPLQISIVKDASPTIVAPAPVCFQGVAIAIDLSVGQTVPVGTPKYSINGSVQTSPIYNITAPGTYQLSIIDGNGCESNIVSYEVKPQVTLVAELLQDLTCTLAADIKLTPGGGTGVYPTYEVEINNSGTYVALPAAYAAGTYKFRVTDSQGCMAVSNIITVTPTTTPTATFAQTNVSCKGGSNGSIVVTAADGISPYKYQLSQGATILKAFSTADTFTDLAAGNYDIQVMDAKGCVSAKVPVTITEPTLLTATSSVTTALSCTSGNAPSKAVVTVVPSGGTTPYQYSYDNGASYSSTATYETFAGATFDVMVKDANGCTVTITNGVNVPALNPPTDLTFATTVPVTCLVNGTVEITSHTNGVAPFQYEILSPIVRAKQPGTTFANLDPDTYVFQITDANGCTYNESYTVAPVTNITVASSLIKNVSCNGGADGSIKFTVENKAGGFTYSLSPAVGTATQVGDVITVTNLPANTYTLSVIDAITGCPATATIDVAQPAILEVALVSKTPANCYLGSIVTVQATGGTPVYKYAFVKTGVTPVASDYTTSNSTVLAYDDLGANDWDVYVQDANLICSDKTTITITKHAAPTIDPNANVYCYTGGPVPITITGTTDPSIATPPMYSIGNGYYASPNFTLNAPGTYEFFIKDGNGCVAKATYVLRQELLIQATLTQDLNCTTNNATITLKATQGTGAGTYSFEYDLNNSGIYQPVTALPFVTSTAGTYTFRVKDAVTCEAVSVPVVVTPLTIPMFNTAVVDALCQGDSNGSITVTASNGVAPYKYSINGGTFVNSNIFAGLSKGTYAISVMDAKGCSSASVNVNINEPVVLTAANVVSPFGCDPSNIAKDALVTLTAHDGTGPYSYSFDNGVTFGSSPTHIVNAASTINYVVVDVNGCRATGSVTVPAYNPPTKFDLSATPIYCNTVGGAATITVSNIVGGVAPYNYAIVQPAASATSNATGSFANLLPGTYQIKVTDTNGCSTLSSIEVKKASEINVDAQLMSDVLCNGGATGSIAFTISNYIAPANYTFALSPNNGTFTKTGDVVTYTGLTAASYTFTVTDNTSGCTDNVSNFIVNQPVAPLNFTMTATNITCNNKNATITVTATGGTPAYGYAAVANGTAAPTAFSSDSKIVVDTNNGTVLAWDVYVKDLNGCTTLVQTQNISTAPLPSGITASVTSQCPSAAGTYDFTVTVTSGVGPFEYSIGGGFQSSPTFSVNSSGSYDITVRDANGCTTTVTGAVVISGALDLQLDVQKLPSCDFPDGRIVAKATGGSGNYRYTSGAYIPVVAGTTATFNNMAAGSHTITVEDLTTGCKDIVTVEMKAATLITGLNLEKTDVNCNGESNGRIIVHLAPNAPGVNDNPVYTYTLTGTTIGGVPVSVGPQEENVFDNLQAGDYTVKVTSGRGCNAQVDTRIIQPAPIVVNAPTVSSFVCTTGTNTTNFASITVNSVTGGTAPYILYEFSKNGTVVQSSSSNVYNETDLTGGTYSVRVFDSKGCEGTSTAPIVIAPFITMDKVNVNVVTPITCINNETIQVSVATTGGTPTGLVYTVSGVSGTVFNQTNSTGLFSGLAIGNYAVSIFNPTTGCTIKDFHFVFDPNTFEIDVTPVKDELCYGDADGSVDLMFVDNQLNPTNDAGSFTYTITGPVTITGTAANAGPVRITGLKAGQYSVTAKLVGRPECTVTNVFTIQQPLAPLAVTTTKSEITCITGNNDGEISASATGGWGTNYQYELVGPTVHITYSDKFEFTGLTAGNYTINVKDENGCIATTNVQLVVPAPIVVTASANASMLSCFGSKDGVITVNQPTGGQGSNYMYTLNIVSANPVIVSGPQSGRVFSNLSAGTYTITVTDGYSCEATSATIVISEPTEVQATLDVSRVQTCMTQSQITLGATGGKAPYTYSTTANFATVIGTFASSVSFDVPVGTYQYYVKDASGCVGFVSNAVKIDPLVPLTLELDVTNAVVKCQGETTGVIVAKAIGGLGNYRYTLLNNAGTAIRPAQADGRFENLAIGTYSVKVDSQDCTFTSKAIVITEPATPVTAQFNVTNVSCFGENNGKLEILAQGGTGVIKYALSPNLNQFDDVHVFEKLSPGNYQVIVQDANGCFILHDFTITQPELLRGKEVPNSMIPEVCVGDKDGAFSVEILGGTAPYKVSLDVEKGPFTNGAVGQTIFDFTKLTGGKHTVYFTDAAGCMNYVEINMPLPVVLDPKAEINYDCVDNHAANRVTITVDASITNPADVDYKLDATGAYQSSNIFTNLAPGNHYVTARHTNGCEVPTVSFEIKAVKPLAIALAAGKPEMNVISVVATGGAPAYEYSFNGEPFSSSTKFKIYKSGDYVIVVRDQNGCTATITVPMKYIDVCLDNYFTPNGDGVYDTWGPGCTNIYNNLEFSIFDRYGRVIAKYHYGQKWDGRYNGEELPSGDYWYVLKLNDEKDAREFVGHFTLYR
ncbi:T9SS type B sorting domain-containing protein [Flavobacterium mesophilum]|uniref:T9SS type B sorting domain-containing protein n=1 Tax=Flavobacterium mesophilum TaxID=3143495 RepID=UPI0031D74332